MDIIEFRQNIWDLFKALSQGIEGLLRVTIESYGVTMAQMRVLVEVQHRQQSTVGELSTAVGSAQGNMSAMCKGLERKGLVRRSRNPEDERIVFITMTEQGTRLLQQIDQELRAKGDPVLAEYSAEDFSEIVLGINKLKDVATRLRFAFEPELGGN